MSIERLRALEKDLREEERQQLAESRRHADEGNDETVQAFCNGKAFGLNSAAQRIATLIAELGQEVGAVYAHPVELEAARRNYARGLADGLLTVSVQPIPGFVPLYNSSATPTAAADSERLDWVINHPGQVVTKWGHESSWHVVGAITGHIISRGHASYREAIDAAMRQARRTRRPLDFTATGR